MNKTTQKFITTAIKRAGSTKPLFKSTVRSGSVSLLAVNNSNRSVHTTNNSNASCSVQQPAKNEVDHTISTLFSTSEVVNSYQCDSIQHEIFSLPQHLNELTQLLQSNPHIQIQDKIELQLRELVKLENPSLHPMSEELYQKKIEEKLNGQPLHEFGNWVYYPWRNSLVHVLNENDFVRVRTIRNAFKISPEEQQALQKKTVLVVGLSVGQSVAMTLSMERSCGHLILADFDHLDLSNMNRLRASVMDLGIMKGTVIKRAIVELDPYFKVTLLQDGLTKENVAQVLGSTVKNVDLVIEECDSFDAKVLVRKHCKKLQIPVVMETSDRGLLDVERFDLDKDYPILHGLVHQDMLEIEQFTPQHKQQLIAQFLDVKMASKRGLFSFSQVGKTLTSWPQLASEVSFGSSVAAMVSRMIFLGENVPSQRQYLDIPERVSTFKK